MAKAMKGNMLVDACCLDPFSDDSIDLCVVSHMIEDKTFLSDSTEYLHRFITNYLHPFGGLLKREIAISATILRSY